MLLYYYIGSLEFSGGDTDLYQPVGKLDVVIHLIHLHEHMSVILKLSTRLYNGASTTTTTPLPTAKKRSRRLFHRCTQPKHVKSLPPPLQARHTNPPWHQLFTPGN